MSLTLFWTLYTFTLVAKLYQLRISLLFGICREVDPQVLHPPSYEGRRVTITSQSMPPHPLSLPCARTNMLDRTFLHTAIKNLELSSESAVVRNISSDEIQVNKKRVHRNLLSSIFISFYELVFVYLFSCFSCEQWYRPEDWLVHYFYQDVSSLFTTALCLCPK